MHIKEEVEIGLGSLGKLKIIKALAEGEKLATVYMLHKKTRLKRDDIKNNLDDLAKIGWVTASKFANTMYKLNIENVRVKKLVDYLKDVEYVDHQ